MFKVNLRFLLHVDVVPVFDMVSVCSNNIDREEADELCRTSEEGEDKSRTASEMADLVYHAMVFLAVQGVKLEDVFEHLRERFAQSGIEEKKNRARKVDQSAITKD